MIVPAVPKYTLEALRKLRPDQVRDLYLRALKAGADGKDIVDQILENDLLIEAGGGYPREHPTIREIEEIVGSKDCLSAACAAADEGLPAMAGVDPILQERLGSRYGQRDTTSWAGTFVADEMRKKGYRKVQDSRPLPPNCRAKTAAYFEPNAT